jgi:hypothetical protein
MAAHAKLEDSDAPKTKNFQVSAFQNCSKEFGFIIAVFVKSILKICIYQIFNFLANCHVRSAFFLNHRHKTGHHCLTYGWISSEETSLAVVLRW